MHRRGPGCGGRLGTMVVQSSLNPFPQQPQYILWHLEYALDNASRQGTMQCQETCPRSNQLPLMQWTGTRGIPQRAMHKPMPHPLCPNPRKERFETKSAVAHKWAGWLHNPCRLRGPQRFSGGQNQPWPTSGRIGYITPPIWGVPNASGWGQNKNWPNKWADWLHNPCCRGGPQHFRAGDKISSGPQVGVFLLSFLLSGKNLFF